MSLSKRIVIPLTGVRDVEKGSCLGKGSIDKMSLFGACFLSCSSRKTLWAIIVYIIGFKMKDWCSLGILVLFTIFSICFFL